MAIHPAVDNEFRSIFDSTTIGNARVRFTFSRWTATNNGLFPCTSRTFAIKRIQIVQISKWKRAGRSLAKPYPCSPRNILFRIFAVVVQAERSTTCRYFAFHRDWSLNASRVFVFRRNRKMQCFYTLVIYASIDTAMQFARPIRIIVAVLSIKMCVQRDTNFTGRKRIY